MTRLKTSILTTFCALGTAALLFNVGACAEEDSADGDTASGDGDGDGDGAGDGDGDGDGTGDGDGDGDGTGDGDGDGDGTGNGYFEDSACFRMLECFSVILPGQYDAAYEQYGPESDCWDDVDAALVCHGECDTQVKNAKDANPGIGECHGEYCPIEELTPDLPYSPTSDGCLDGEVPTTPAGMQGSYCAPECSGLADFCPGHQDTIATGTCLNSGYCALLCYYEHTNPPLYGIQCPCGARCEPLGQQDGNGNDLGFCTYVE